jgi:hypothetical protein
MWPVAANLATDLTKLDAHSALPRAPKLPIEPPKKTRRQKFGRSLRGTAFRLHRLADRLDPATC